VGADGQGRGTPRRRRQVVLRTLGRTVLIGTVLLALYVTFTLPPRAVRLVTPLPPTSVAGAFHVHTNRSDGSGSPGDVAAAAARAGLRFVVLTDHGDAMRAPEPPAYRDGVLLIDAVEIGTLGGHVVALGLRQPAPFPLAGESRDVIDDIHRLGGVAIASHTDSPKPTLRWSDEVVRYDGIEWMNADTEWRDESRIGLALTGLRSLFRGPESIVSLFSRPVASLERWDRAQRARHVFGIAALDAHARLGEDDGNGRPGRFALRAPGYAQMFGAVAQVVQLDAPLSGDAAADAATILAAIAAGRSYSAVHGLAAPARFEFSAEQGGRRVPMGGELEPGERAIFEARVPDGPGVRLALAGGAQLLAIGTGHLITQRPVSAPFYRVEVFLPGRPMPWIVSNPIFVRQAPAAVPAAPSSVTTTELPASGEWAIERDPASTVTVTPGPKERRVDVGLAPGIPSGQYGAIVAPVDAGPRFEAVALTLRAAQPARISVQLRRGELRWRRSIYVDSTPRSVTIPVAEFDAILHTTPLDPQGDLRLLLVVDTLNTATGTAVTFFVSEARFAR
jgi:hypothetical protein